MTPAAIDELKALVENQAAQTQFLPVSMTLLRAIVAEWAAGQSQSNDEESFICGARWARMAAEKSFDDDLLRQDAKYFASTGGNIRCRGDGTLKHVLKELNK